MGAWLPFAAAAVVALAACGGDGGTGGGSSSSEAGSDAGQQSESGQPDSGGPLCEAGAHQAPVGRTAGAVCDRSPLSVPGIVQDAGLSCTSGSDCASYPYLYCSMGCCVGGDCLHGMCGWDGCLSDDDCAAGAACVCRGGLRGQNVCFPATCRVDSDCGPGGVCSFSGFLESCPLGYGPSCEVGGCATEGFYCHTAADTCLTNSDCCGSTECEYQPTLGHWACQAYSYGCMYLGP
jgi:hypothetical protein